MPVQRTLLQSLVVGLFALLNQLFNADVFTHDIARPVKEQQGKQPAHTPVSIIKGVDAQEIQNKHGNEKQWVHLPGTNSLLIRSAKGFHRLRSLPRGYRLKTNGFVSLSIRLGNYIVRCFVVSAVGHAAEFV